MKGHWPQNLADDVKRRFDHWYASQHHQRLVESLQQQGVGHQPLALLNQQRASQLSGPGGNNNGALLSHRRQHSPSLMNGSTAGLSNNGTHHHHLASQHHRHHHDLQANKSSAFDEDSSSNHPVFHALNSHQKTRMRTSFDPEMELPKLQKWFGENPHPSRHQVITFYNC